MINITTKDGRICMSQIYPVTDETVEKMHASLNAVNVCLKDMRVNYHLINRDLKLYKVANEDTVSEKDIKVFKVACDTVMDFIEKLPVLEPAKELAQPIDKQVSENLKFCESVLKDYNETEDEFGIIGAIIYCGSDDKEIAMPCGCINRELFRELLTLYIEKYGNGNKN